MNKGRSCRGGICVLLIFLIWSTLGCRPKSEQLYHQAVKQARRGEYDESIASLRQYLQFEPRSCRGYNALGRIYRARNNYSRAIEELKKALELDPDDPLPPYNLAAIYQQMDNAGKARQYYRLARQRRPDFAPALYRLAVLSSREGNLDEARKEYEAFLRLKPKSACGHNNLGVVLYRQGEKEKASEEFLQATRLNHDLPFAYFNLGVSYLGREDSKKEARRVFKRYVKLWPYAPEEEELRLILAAPIPSRKKDYLREGMDYQARGDLSRAEESYRKALRVHPRDRMPHYYLGQIYEKRARTFPAAIKQYEEFLRDNLKSPRAQEVIGRLEKLRTGRDQRLLVKEQLASPPSSPSPSPPPTPAITPPPSAEELFRSGLKMEKRGRLAAAATAYQKALEIRKNYPPAVFHTGLVRLKQGNYQAALPLLERAYRRDGSPPVAAALGKTCFKLGEAAFSDGREKEGRSYYRRYLRLLPRGREAPKIRELLQAAPVPAPPAPKKKIPSPPQRKLPSPKKSARSYYNRGAVYQRNGNTSAAESEYLTALRLQPNFYQAYYNLGVLYSQSGSYRKALTAYKKAALLKPDFARAQLALCNLYYHHFQMKTLARRHARNYLALEPNSPSAAVLKEWLTK